MMPRILILAGAVALAAGTAGAQSLGFGAAASDTGAPVEVTADTLSVDQATGQATFTGHVFVGQGAMRLAASSVTVRYADGNQQKIEALNATGGVTLVSGPDAAEASEAVYDVGAGTIVLTGDAMVTRGKGILAGDRIEVSLRDGTARVAGRVRTVLQPGAK